MTTSFYLYALLVAALSLALSFFGSRWIEGLYGKNREILTFPDDVERRGRWRPYVLGVLFLACGIRFLYLLNPGRGVAHSAAPFRLAALATHPREGGGQVTWRRRTLPSKLVVYGWRGTAKPPKAAL